MSRKSDHGQPARLLREIYRLIGNSVETPLVDETQWVEVLARAGLEAEEASKALACLWHARAVLFDKDTGAVRLTREGIESATRFR
jgi:hypothetical protein